MSRTIKITTTIYFNDKINNTEVDALKAGILSGEMQKDFAKDPGVEKVEATFEELD